jgi:hypothetical protein
VFIALRLSLAAAYARRGVTIPLVLDDVLVNFDSVRAESAAKVLRDFATLGHQVVMFTCHEHIMKIFHNIGVQVRVLPPQGQPGEAIEYVPELEIEQQPIERIVYLPAPTPEPVVYLAPEPAKPTPLPVVELPPAPVIVPVAAPVAPEPTPAPAPAPIVKRVVVVEREPQIDWLWYEQNEEPEPEPSANVDMGWVESEDFPDEKLPPPDLWWNRATGSVAPSAVID